MLSHDMQLYWHRAHPEMYVCSSAREYECVYVCVCLPFPGVRRCCRTSQPSSRKTYLLPYQMKLTCICRITCILLVFNVSTNWAFAHMRNFDIRKINYACSWCGVNPETISIFSRSTCRWLGNELSLEWTTSPWRQLTLRIIKWRY